MGWVVDLARKLSIDVLVAHPGDEAWQWGKVKRKTDKDDALKLAKMARNDEINSVHVPSPEHRQFQQLVRYRKKLQAQATATQNAIRSNLMAQGEECAAGKAAWSKVYMEGKLGKLRKPFEACTPSEYWRGTLDVRWLERSWRTAWAMLRDGTLWTPPPEIAFPPTSNA